MPETIERTSRRDARVDHVGFCNELVKHFAEPTKVAVKNRLLERELDLAEGDFFEGLLIRTCSSVIDPGKLLRLFEKRQITREQFVSAISVRREAAKDFLPGIELAEISEEMPAIASLRITRRKGVEVKLADALRGLGEVIGSGHE